MACSAFARSSSDARFLRPRRTSMNESDTVHVYTKRMYYNSKEGLPPPKQVAIEKYMNEVATPFMTPDTNPASCRAICRRG